MAVLTLSTPGAKPQGNTVVLHHISQAGIARAGHKACYVFSYLFGVDARNRQGSEQSFSAPRFPVVASDPDVVQRQMHVVSNVLRMC